MFYGGATEKIWKRSGFGANAAWSVVSTIGGTPTDLHATGDRLILHRTEGSVWTRPHLPENQIFDLVPENWVVPGRWNSLAPGSLQVQFGNDPTAFTSDRVIEAVSYQYAGATDIAMLRLRTAVPTTIAVPMRVVAPRTTAPAWGSQSFKIAGWGLVDPRDATVRRAPGPSAAPFTMRQIGTMLGGAV
jgi:hypothetical protein